MWKCFVVIRKHCIELDDANKFNAKFQCTTQSYLQFFFRVNVFADFVPKTGCWIRQCWFYWPSPSESLIYLIIQINPPPSRRGYRPILFPTLCVLFFICFWGSVSHNIFQDNKILNGQIPFRIIQNQSWRSWMFDSAAVYFVISAANKLKSRVFFALTLTLRMTPRR